ncbi:hypothetical protein AURDEDRAFT_116665 [Auricularia subglabra TFB-10046 SS5]|uniref:WD-like domain-containing protein n=1 Tax=Auricularia subglabra (strain TFB-10046 / SS5) TaxID=717982 RepID=J0D0M6_AURST|nr:hypothetical protein AURDEDRAFT_116665 [Auricularia subglabra TFB-10046 SS5]
MLFAKTLILAALAVFQVQAAPAPGDEALVVLKTEDSIHGPLVFYGLPGAANETVEARGLTERACGTNNVQCFGSNVPNRQACQNLINSLNANSGSSVGNSPRSICQTTNGNQCCVSWANVASGLTQGMLVSAANAVQNGCVVNGQSGLSRNTNLNGVCTTQCLSSRATGCS